MSSVAGLVKQKKITGVDHICDMIDSVKTGLTRMALDLEYINMFLDNATKRGMTDDYAKARRELEKIEVWVNKLRNAEHKSVR